MLCTFLSSSLASPSSTFSSVSFSPSPFSAFAVFFFFFLSSLSSSTTPQLNRPNHKCHTLNPATLKIIPSHFPFSHGDRALRPSCSYATSMAQTAWCISVGMTSIAAARARISRQSMPKRLGRLVERFVMCQLESRDTRRWVVGWVVVDIVRSMIGCMMRCGYKDAASNNNNNKELNRFLV